MAKKIWFSIRQSITPSCQAIFQALTLSSRHNSLWCYHRGNVIVFSSSPFAPRRLHEWELKRRFRSCNPWPLIEKWGIAAPLYKLVFLSVFQIVGFGRPFQQQWLDNGLKYRLFSIWLELSILQMPFSHSTFQPTSQTFSID